MKFNPLFVTPQWLQEYHTKYPHGQSILESLIEWVNSTNVLIDNVNDWNSYLHNFVESFDKNLKDEVIEVVQSWIASGYIEVVISAALQTQINDIMEHNEIEPDDLRSNPLETDTYLVQKALDQCMMDRANNSIKLGRIYNIDSPLKINNEGVQLVIRGANGGFSNKQNGPMFTSDNIDSNGMMLFQNVKFVGDDAFLTSPYFDCGQGTKLIQIIFQSCSFYNCPTIVYSSWFLQSIRFLGCTFKVPNDYVVKAQIGYDITIADCSHETGKGGLISLTTEDINQYCSYSVRISNNVIQAITDQPPIKLTQNLNIDISGNYFEGNIYPDIDMSGAIKQHKGVTIKNNFFGEYVPSAVKTSCVKTGLLYENQGYDFSGNTGVKTIWDFTNSGGRYINLTGGLTTVAGAKTYTGIADENIVYGQRPNAMHSMELVGLNEYKFLVFDAGSRIIDNINNTHYVKLCFKRSGSDIYTMHYAGFLYFVTGYNSATATLEMEVKFKPILTLTSNNFNEEVDASSLLVTFGSSGTNRIPITSLNQVIWEEIKFKCNDVNVNGGISGKIILMDFLATSY